MSQLNIHLNPDFERVLSEFMQIRNIKNKSEAVRVAVQESLQRSLAENRRCDFRSWLGLGLGEGENRAPHFPHDDLLWS